MTNAIGRIVGGEAPVFLLIAGPNGASKSTFSEKRLKPIGLTCIDPDAVALELLGRHPVDVAEALRATKEATRRTRQRISEHLSVALETVFSDTEGHKLNLLREAQAAGFRTVLIFIGVDSPDLCIARVMGRVELGGHDIPDEVIRDRFPRCFANLKKALAIVDLAILVDNTGCYGVSGDAEFGARHYQFGEFERGKLIRIEKTIPRWYLDFQIGPQRLEIDFEK